MVKIDNYYRFCKLDFRNELIKRLNENTNRYLSKEYSQLEFFDVDEVYEIIDRVYNGIPEDDGSVD